MTIQLKSKIIKAQYQHNGTWMVWLGDTKNKKIATSPDLNVAIAGLMFKWDLVEIVPQQNPVLPHQPGDEKGG